MSATLEHIPDFEKALSNILCTTEKLFILRTFVGDKSLSDYCRTHGALEPFLIHQFTLPDLRDIAESNGWLLSAEDHDCATGGEMKLVCNGESVARRQSVIIFEKEDMSCA